MTSHTGNYNALPYNLPPAALAEDTPSRHVCKVVVSKTSPEERRYIYNPYKGLRQPPPLQTAHDDSDDECGVVEDAFSNLAIHEGLVAITQRSTSTASDSTNHTASTSPVPPSLNGTQIMTSTNSAEMKFCSVRFKFTEGTFFVPPTVRGAVNVGDIVVVQGDRGENIGSIAYDLSPMYPHDASSATAMPQVVRKALNKDRKRFFQARRKEAHATIVSAQLAVELNLPMQVLDCEFQADLQKLTLFYRNMHDGAVDFRQLQRSLYKTFRCRIWLLNWDIEFHEKMKREREMAKLRIGGASFTGNEGPAPLL